MNPLALPLGLAATLALVGAALGRRGSRSARSFYMEGACDVMGIALHRLTGLPISAIWDGPLGRGAGPTWDPDSAIDHVVVMVDAHRYLDATGIHTHPHRLEPLGPARYGGVAEPCPAEEAVVSDLFSTSTMSAEEREQAIQTAIQHVLSDPELRALVNPFSVGRGSRSWALGNRNKPTLSAERGSRASLVVDDYDGETGRFHVTRRESGTLLVRDLIAWADPPEHGARTWTVHEGARYFGNYAESDWNKFLADIRQRGIHEPLNIRVMPGKFPMLREGNHRLQAAVQLGLEEVPVIIDYFGRAEREGRVAPGTPRIERRTT